MIDANLTGADLTSIYLKDSIFINVIGVGTQTEEIEFAKNLLDEIEQNPKCFNMKHWCGTAKCIAGHAFPDLYEPARAAGTKYPTLAQYFLTTDEEARAALERVANGEESVFC
jgi:hypothetical protein